MLPEVKAVVFIPLTQGKVAVIDFEDFEKVRPYNWYAHKNDHTWYARRTDYEKSGIVLHRFLLNATKGVKTDHKNGDGLDCRSTNIRICSTSQNAQSYQTKRSGMTSRYRGVFWDKHKARTNRAPWIGRICADGVNIHCGAFDNEEDAARAYDAKARELFGEWASPNFPV